MDPKKEFLTIRDMAKAFGPVWAKGRSLNDRNLEIHLDAVKYKISSYRRRLRDVKEMGTKTVRFRIFPSIRTIFDDLRSRTTVSVKLGAKKGGEKPSRGSIKITVGVMWERRVKNVFYPQSEHIHPFSDNLFPIDAHEVKVNVRNIRLYEVLFYDISIDKNVTLYVAETMRGPKRFATANSASLAVKKAQELIVEEITKTMQGENDDKAT